MAALDLHGETAALWGGQAQVSPADLFELRRYRWWVQVSNGGPYAYTWARDAAGRIVEPRRKIYMHRLVAQTPPGLEADHRNRDTLDNRRENLRNVSRLENSGRRSYPDDDDYAAYLEQREAVG